MDCEKILIHLNRYNDDELAPKQVREVEMHLDSCPACRAELEIIREMDLLLEESYTPEPSADFVSSVMKGIEKKKKTSLLERFTPVLAGSFSFVLFFIAGMLLTTATSVTVDGTDSDPIVLLEEYASEDTGVAVISSALFDSEDLK